MVIIAASPDSVDIDCTHRLGLKSNKIIIIRVFEKKVRHQSCCVYKNSCNIQFQGHGDSKIKVV